MAKGSRATAAKQIAGEILDDPEYRRVFKLRAISGDLPPAVETLLWHYRYGKPAEHVVIDHGEDLSDMSTDELAELITGLQRELAETAPKETTH